MNGQPPDDGMSPDDWQAPYPPARPAKSGWSTVAIVVAVVVAVAGLVILALAVAFFVSISQLGSNK